jgi:hypothetical protein
MKKNVMRKLSTNGVISEMAWLIMKEMAMSIMKMCVISQWLMANNNVKISNNVNGENNTAV